MTVLAAALITAGTFFLAVSVVGLLRLPDFYTRAHAAAKSETLGILLVFGGLLVHNGFAPGSLRLVLVFAFSLAANPTAIHALARAARHSGVEAWTKEKA